MDLQAFFNKLHPVAKSALIVCIAFSFATTQILIGILFLATFPQKFSQHSSEQKALSSASNTRQKDTLIKAIDSTQDESDENSNEFDFIAFCGVASLQDIQSAVEQGYSVNMHDHNGFTPLMRAAQSNSLEVVKFLVNSGAYLNTIAKGRRTPLTFAVQANSPEIVQFLIDAGASPDVQLEDGTTLLMIVSRLQNVSAIDTEKLIRILSKYEKNIDAKDYSGTTALLYAIQFQNFSAMKTLIELGAELHTARSANFNSPILYASLYGNLEIVKFLFDKGGKLLTDKDKFENNALHYAALGNSIEVIDFILKQGLDVNSLNRVKATPLMYAARHNTLEVVEFLLKNGANPILADIEGTTAKDSAQTRSDSQSNSQIQSILEVLDLYSSALQSSSDT